MVALFILSRSHTAVMMGAPLMPNMPMTHYNIVYHVVYSLLLQQLTYIGLLSHYYNQKSKHYKLKFNNLQNNLLNAHRQQDIIKKDNCLLPW